MAIGMSLGVITPGAIANELASRGISVGVPALPGVTLPHFPPPISPKIEPPPPIVPPPEDPDQPVTVLPRGKPQDYYEPYIPIYPPAVVSPEDVTVTPIMPYIPVRPQPEPEEKKGLDKNLMIIIGVAALGLMMFARPRSGRRGDEYQRRRPGRRY